MTLISDKKLGGADGLSDNQILLANLMHNYFEYATEDKHKDNLMFELHVQKYQTDEK